MIKKIKVYCRMYIGRGPWSSWYWKFEFDHCHLLFMVSKDQENYCLHCFLTPVYLILNLPLLGTYLHFNSGHLTFVFWMCRRYGVIISTWFHIICTSTWQIMFLFLFFVFISSIFFNLSTFLRHCAHRNLGFKCPLCHTTTLTSRIEWLFQNYSR
jgi:hypothetical protein